MFPLLYFDGRREGEAKLVPWHAEVRLPVLPAKITEVGKGRQSGKYRTGNSIAPISEPPRCGGGGGHAVNIPAITVVGKDKGEFRMHVAKWRVLPPPPLCISYAPVQATVGVGTDNCVRNLNAYEM